MDGGNERPVGFGFGLVGTDPNAEEKNPVYEAAFAKLEQIGRLLEAIDAQEIRRGGGGADSGFADYASWPTSSTRRGSARSCTSTKRR